MMNPIANLHMAMRFQAERGDTPAGRATADLRMRLATDTDGWRATAERAHLVQAEAARLMALTRDDMPPTSDDLALLIDTLAFRLGATSRAKAWRSIGIKPRQGDDLMKRGIQHVSWPIWFTLRHAALSG